MAISLFEHNAAAYCAACDMLSEEGKAAIVHPTGTGKSFIAFRFCEDHPDKRVCWVSPSAYIFQTQVENLMQSTGGQAQRKDVDPGADSKAHHTGISLGERLFQAEGNQCLKQGLLKNNIQRLKSN